MQYFLKDLMIMLSGMAFHAADTHRVTSEWRLKETCGLEPRTSFIYLFFRLRNRQKKNQCGLDSRIYGNTFHFMAQMESFENVHCAIRSQLIGHDVYTKQRIYWTRRDPRTSVYLPASNWELLTFISCLIISKTADSHSQYARNIHSLGPFL